MNLQHVTLEKLVETCQEYRRTPIGNSAIEELVRRVTPVIRRIAIPFLPKIGTTLEDAIQDGIVVVIETIDTYDRSVVERGYIVYLMEKLSSWYTAASTCEDVFSSGMNECGDPIQQMKCREFTASRPVKERTRLYDVMMTLAVLESSPIELVEDYIENDGYSYGIIW